MKKVLYFALCAATMAFAACNCNKNTEEVADTTVATEECCHEGCPMSALNAAIEANDAAATTEAVANLTSMLTELQGENVAKAQHVAGHLESVLAEKAEVFTTMGVDVTALTAAIEAVKALPVAEGACCEGHGEGEHHCCGNHAEGEHHCGHDCQK